MKTLILGDTHGTQWWKLIVNTEKDFERVVFIGDYFDSFHFNTEEQVNNFLDIIEYKKTSGKEVILLIGNHDHHYFPEIGDTGTGGYQQIGKYLIERALDINRKHLQMAYQFDNVLCTHAGVSEVFMDDCFGKDGWSFAKLAEVLNELWKHKPRAFIFNGRDYTGDSMEQTPIWIRPNSLMKASQNIKKAGIIQVVGHTHQKSIDIKGKSTGGKYFFIDTLLSSGEYLIHENGVFTVGNTK